MADEVSALVAVTRPIIAGIYHSIGQDTLNGFGVEREEIKLQALGQARREGDGDTGIAFEYAVHDAVMNGVPIVVERVAEALRQCRIRQGDPSSILFAIEKNGAQQLISTKIDLITAESRVLSGERGQPIKLQGYLNQLAAAFRRPNTRAQLPQSIRGLWKADLFLGSTEPDHWVGTTVKINRSHLEAARGLRVAIVPSRSGASDAIKKDEQKNLIVCPMPHDGSFMQIFYEGWRIVQVLCNNNFTTPKEVDLPNPSTGRLHGSTSNAEPSRCPTCLRRPTCSPNRSCSSSTRSPPQTLRSVQTLSRRPRRSSRRFPAWTGSRHPGASCHPVL